MHNNYRDAYQSLFKVESSDVRAYVSRCEFTAYIVLKTSFMNGTQLLFGIMIAGNASIYNVWQGMAGGGGGVRGKVSERGGKWMCGVDVHNMLHSPSSLINALITDDTYIRVKCFRNKNVPGALMYLLNMEINFLISLIVHACII